ncbi:MAG: MerR family transcriptional regulator [Bacteroidales bacterium]|nr:MerR family transcriptional regulator [Bacteroidales bacterium]MDT8431804.1 MerR family transcriptional regulator [Bacteroidales bacterium]
MEEAKTNSTEPVYTLGVSARLSDTPAHSVRMYVDKNLLIPYKKKTNRHLFSKIDVVRLQCIRHLIDEQGLNIAGIKALFSMVPCWRIKNCPEEERKNCGAYYSNSQTCWEASEKGNSCKNEDCRVCSVYKLTEECADMKSLIRKLLP